MIISSYWLQLFPSNYSCKYTTRMQTSGCKFMILSSPSPSLPLSLPFLFLSFPMSSFYTAASCSIKSIITDYRLLVPTEQVTWLCVYIIISPRSKRRAKPLSLGRNSTHQKIKAIVRLQKTDPALPNRLSQVEICCTRNITSELQTKCVLYYTIDRGSATSILRPDKLES